MYKTGCKASARGTTGFNNFRTIVIVFLNIQTQKPIAEILDITKYGINILLSTNRAVLHLKARTYGKSLTKK